MKKYFGRNKLNWRKLLLASTEIKLEIHLLLKLSVKLLPAGAAEVYVKIESRKSCGGSK